MSTAIRYIAAPNHVREVTLRGTADLSFWKKRLEAEDLIPVVRAERAELMITAANMAFMGLRFTEISFSVAVVPARFSEVLVTSVSCHLAITHSRNLRRNALGQGHERPVDPQ